MKTAITNFNRSTSAVPKIEHKRANFYPVVLLPDLILANLPKQAISKLTGDLGFLDRLDRAIAPLNSDRRWTISLDRYTSDLHRVRCLTAYCKFAKTKNRKMQEQNIQKC